MSLAPLSKAMMVAGGLVMAASPVLTSAAMAQDGPPIRDPYATPAAPQAAQGDYRNMTPPPEPTAPQGYDGKQLPPPPQGYVPPADASTYQAADARYAADAQRWARDNCVKSQPNVAGGALVGGILGALIGGGLAGRGSHGAGMAAGAMVGAVGGAAVASSSQGDTSPGCPPGYVARNGAPAYSYAPAGYYYAAPSWYTPWVFIDGFWVYRPYPYHDWYYRTYRVGPGWHGGPRYGGGWHRH